jgi:hypothetical protein
VVRETITLPLKIKVPKIRVGQDYGCNIIITVVSTLLGDSGGGKDSTVVTQEKGDCHLECDESDVCVLYSSHFTHQK